METLICRYCSEVRVLCDTDVNVDIHFKYKENVYMRHLEM